MTQGIEESEVERTYQEWLEDALAQDARRWAELEKELVRLRGTAGAAGARARVKGSEAAR